MENICYCPDTANPCRKLETRRDGLGLYLDLVSGARIICRPEIMHSFPAPANKRHGFKKAA